MPRKPHNSPQKQGKSKGRNPPEATRFKPGQSGNPGGRPKGRTLLKTIRDLLYERGDPEALEKIANGYIDAMKRGSFPHLKEFIDREEGKVPDRVANADGSNLGEMDYSKLTTDELTLYRALLLKAKTREPAG
jgi:hypothetical protein